MRHPKYSTQPKWILWWLTWEEEWKNQNFYYIMALNATTLYCSIPSKSFFLPKPKHLYFSCTFSPASSSCFGVHAFSEETEGGLADQEDFSTYSGTHTTHTFSSCYRIKECLVVASGAKTCISYKSTVPKRSSIN